jgi:hypothetical protein
MSARTAHSFGGMRRYMQISATRVFVFVEGRDLDPYVYGKLCGPVCSASAMSYEIVIADSLGGNGGGKAVLIKFFEYLRNNGSLIDRSHADAKLAMFYLDKDVDDVLHTRASSDHVVYTEYYCMENHLFAEGDLVASLAIAGSLDLATVQARVPNAVLWRSTAATRWREWVALCIMAMKLSLTHPASYTRVSSINVPADAVTDAALLGVCVGEMEARSGLVPADFRKTLSACYRFVDAINRRGNHDLLFKGKWYLQFVLRGLEAINPHFNQHGASDRLVGGLIATTDFNAPWSRHFRQPLQNALAAL